MALNQGAIEGFITYIKSRSKKNGEGKEIEYVEFGLSYFSFLDNYGKKNLIKCFKKSSELRNVKYMYTVGDHVLFTYTITTIGSDAEGEIVLYVREIVPIRTRKAVHNFRKESDYTKFKHIPGFDAGEVKYSK